MHGDPELLELLELETFELELLLELLVHRPEELEEEEDEDDDDDEEDEHTLLFNSNNFIRLSAAHASLSKVSKSSYASASRSLTEI